MSEEIQEELGQRNLLSPVGGRANQEAQNRLTSGEQNRTSENYENITLVFLRRLLKNVTDNYRNSCTQTISFNPRMGVPSNKMGFQDCRL